MKGELIGLRSVRLTHFIYHLGFIFDLLSEGGRTEYDVAGAVKGTRWLAKG
jgi:hypothetical protein